MNIRKYFVLLLAFALLFAAPAAARKKDKKAHTAGSTAVVEPDRLPNSATAHAHHKGSKAIKTAAKGYINNKYKEGFDISHYQGNINWSAVAGEEVSYVYIKATEGQALIDECYESNLRGAKSAGISVSAYHFYRPTVSPQEQLELMTSVVRKEDIDLVPLIDIEARGNISHEQFIDDLRTFIKAVTKHYGRKPLLYTYHNFYNKHLIGEFKDYYWMIARYRDDAPWLDDGIDYLIWQYTSSGSLDGIRGKVDRSRLMPGKTLDVLRM